MVFGISKNVRPAKPSFHVGVLEPNIGLNKKEEPHERRFQQLL